MRLENPTGRVIAERDSLPTALTLRRRRNGSAGNDNGEALSAGPRGPHWSAVVEQGAGDGHAAHLYARVEAEESKKRSEFSPS